jgi:hypothetical protein
MRIGARDHEALQPHRRSKCPQRGQPGRALIGRGVALKLLNIILSAKYSA